MALSEAQLNIRIAALRTARDSGVLIVRHGDELTEFRSLSEMNQILADLEKQLSVVQGKKKSRVSYVSQNDRGYGC